MTNKTQYRGGGIPCPQCGALDTDVCDSRSPIDPSKVFIRRRRDCVKCQHRFTTVEIYKTEYRKLQQNDAMRLELKRLINGEPHAKAD